MDSGLCCQVPGLCRHNKLKNERVTPPKILVWSKSARFSKLRSSISQNPQHDFVAYTMQIGIGGTLASWSSETMP